MPKILKSLLLVSSLLTATCASAFAEGQGVVTQSAPGVLIVRGADELQAVAGTPVLTGDVLKTPAGATADVSLNGLAGVRVLESSELSVDDTDTTSMKLGIRAGNAILNLEKLPAESKFSIETPTAIASVRGTQFWGRVGSLASEPVTTFAVREGAVEVLAKASSQVFTLEKGQALDIDATGTTAPFVRPALDEELSAMAQADSIRTSA